MVKDITEFKDIADLCKLCDDTVGPNIIVKDAEGRFKIMSLDIYNETREHEQKVYENLKIATDELRRGAPLKDAFEFLKEMRAKYGVQV